ncbi:MAG: tetratricopeptide repeat protein [Acidobacteriia bacterium]|nr:tetratricopeptide repeat protein [Terriglobia bacterium]
MKAKIAKSKARAKPGKGDFAPSGERTFHGFWIIVAAALLCDANSWGHQFVMDDMDYIVHNPVIQNPPSILQIVSSPFVHFPNVTLDLYRPLTALTLAINYWISGALPDSFHLFNRLLHVFTSLGIFWVVRRLIPQRPAVAFLTGLLFAVHPVQTEAITYISGRADALAMVLFVFAWLSFIWMRQTNSHLRPYLISVVLYFLALLSKESAITWLGVVLLTEWIYCSQREIKSFFRQLRQDFWRVYSGYILATLVYAALRLAAFRGIAVTPTKFLVNPLVTASFSGRLLTSLKIFFLSIGQLLLPVQFSPDYSFNQIPILNRWTSLGALVVLSLTAVFLVFLVWTYNRSPDVFFCLAYFIITYSVVSNLLVVTGTIRADRLLYMPAFGFCLLGGLGMGYLEETVHRTKWKNPFRASVLVILLLLAGRTVVRNGDWRDQLTLYLRAIHHFPNSVKIHGYLGEQYFTQNQLVEAEVHYRKALSIYPDQPDLLNDMGALLTRKGKSKEAIGYIQRALQLGVNDPKLARINLGQALQADGNFTGAIEQFDWALQQDPLNSVARLNKGNALYLSGHMDEAINEYRRILEIEPLNAAARKNLDLALQNRTPPASTREKPSR